MESEDTKAVIREWLAAWIRRDGAAVDRLFAPDYTVNDTVVGRAGVKRAIELLHTGLSDLAAELDELVAEGDRVAVRWTVRGIHRGDFLGVPPTGRAVRLRGIAIYRVVAGRIVANHEQTNVFEVIQGLKAER